MATLHIEFKDGRYHFRGYRYDRLVDAVRYARSMATNPSSSQVLLASEAVSGRDDRRYARGQAETSNVSMSNTGRPVAALTASR
jgi:hypothetical protein